MGEGTIPQEKTKMDSCNHSWVDFMPASMKKHAENYTRWHERCIAEGIEVDSSMYWDRIDELMADELPNFKNFN
jgi:hypothetical protein